MQGTKTQVQAPLRSLDQRMEALRRANEIRVKRAKLKKDLKAGTAQIEIAVLHPARFVDILVVSRGGFRRGCEDRFGQAFAVLHSARKFVVADRTGRLIIFPARTLEIPADDALDREHGIPRERVAQLAARFPSVQAEVRRRRTAGEYGFYGLTARETRGKIPVILDTDIGDDIDDTWALGMLMTAGFGLVSEVWQAMARSPRLAVVDAIVAPRRDNFNFQAAPPDFKLSGFFYDEGTFDPVPITVRDPQTGRDRRLTIVGILSDVVAVPLTAVPDAPSKVTASFTEKAIKVDWLGVEAGTRTPPLSYGADCACSSKGCPTSR